MPFLDCSKEDAVKTKKNKMSHSLMSTPRYTPVI